MILDPKEQPSSVPSPSPPPDAVRIIIADDHVLFNEGLKQMMAAEPHLQVVGQVYDGHEVEPAVRLYLPHLVLLDVNLPGKDGFDIAHALKKEQPALKIIFITMYSDALLLEQAKAVKGDGYLLKTASKEELLFCIAEVLQGKTCILPGDKRKKAAEEKDAFTHRYKLTKREVEIIKMIKQGLSSQQIADAVFLSVFTVETHRRNINLKLGVKNLAELIRKANEMGF